MDQAQPQQALNRPTSLVLVWGFRTSAALMLIGIIVSAFQQEALHTSLEDIPVVVDEIAKGNGSGIVALAILVMIATPIASTITVALSCMRISDYRYAAVTSVVLVVLVISATISAI